MYLCCLENFRQNATWRSNSSISSISSIIINQPATLGDRTNNSRERISSFYYMPREERHLSSVAVPVCLTRFLFHAWAWWTMEPFVLKIPPTPALCTSEASQQWEVYSVPMISTALASVRNRNSASLAFFSASATHLSSLSLFPIAVPRQPSQNEHRAQD